MIKKIYYNGSVFEPLTPTEDQKKAIDSGITSDKVTTYDGYQTEIDKKQEKLNRTITIKGDITGSVTDTGGDLEIDTTQNPDDLTAVLKEGNTSEESIILQANNITNTLSPNSITITDNNGNSTEISPAKITISSSAGSLTLNFIDGFTITASDEVAEAFRDWLEVIPQTNDIKSISFYADQNTASAAPQGVLAFYPESE